jgi:hypothetical protein
MLAAALLLTAYASACAAAVAPRPAYEFYDAPTVAPARMFMPRKAEPDAAALPAAAAALGAGAAAGPGDPGRWMLADGDGGAFDAWARLMLGVHTMAGAWTAYSFVQGIILLLLIVRWGTRDGRGARGAGRMAPFAGPLPPRRLLLRWANPIRHPHPHTSILLHQAHPRVGLPGSPRRHHQHARCRRAAARAPPRRPRRVHGPVRHRARPLRGRGARGGVDGRRRLL